MVDSAASRQEFEERLAEPVEDAEPSRRPMAPISERAVTKAKVAPPKPAEVPAALPTAVAPVTAGPPPKRKRSWTRPVLFALLPVALVVGGYEYVTGGQVMATDNAYVQAQMIGLSTDVSGTVVQIAVHNNETVAKGQVMFRLRPDAFQVALDGANAQLGTVRNQVLTLQASYQQSLAQIAQAKAELPFYETGFKRQQDLITNGSASKASFDTAEHDLTAARQRLIVAQAQAASMLAQLGGDASQPVEQNPFYLQAKSLVDNAQRDLNDTVVRAPFDGIVTNVDALQVGSYLPAAQQAFMLVSNQNLWVDANPKETELTWVRPGQTATVTVDTYPGVDWKATVQSINPASGSSFSLLPAQNTSGNWVKVVQRIPMRVEIVASTDKPPLRVGMSVQVEIDTGHARGIPEALKPLVASARPYFQRVATYFQQVRHAHG